MRKITITYNVHLDLTKLYTYKQNSNLHKRPDQILQKIYKIPPKCQKRPKLNITRNQQPPTRLSTDKSHSNQTLLKKMHFCMSKFNYKLKNSLFTPLLTSLAAILPYTPKINTSKYNEEINHQPNEELVKIHAK